MAKKRKMKKKEKKERKKKFDLLSFKTFLSQAARRAAEPMSLAMPLY